MKTILERCQRILLHNISWEQLAMRKVIREWARKK